MDLATIKDTIKFSFCNLTNFKERQGALEVITAYSTLNSKIISVFITFSNNRFVVTDNGWLDQNYYSTPSYSGSDTLVDRVIDEYKSIYSVKTTLDKSGTKYHYKCCDSIKEIPACVFDMANFILGSVNANCIQYKDEKEDRERETFRKQASDYLKSIYADSAKFREPLDDLMNIKFSAIITKKSQIYLINYITGSTPNYFENDLRKSIVNFEIAERSKYRDNIKEKISIINNNSEGFLPERSSSIIQLLSEKTTREPIKWTEKEKILDYV